MLCDEKTETYNLTKELLKIKTPHLKIFQNLKYYRYSYHPYAKKLFVLT